RRSGAHPTAPASPPAPALAARPAPAARQDAAPSWPPPEHATGGPDGAARSGDGPRRGLIVAATVVVVGGLALGIGALALRGGPPEEPRNGRSAGAQAAQPSGGAQQPGAADQEPIPAAQYRATRPRGVKVKAVGARAVLVWQVPPAARELPMIVQVLPAGSAPAVSAGKGARSATVTGLDARKGYCFRVGALLRLNQNKPATMSWSKPAACVRGARVQN
ncbi:fibronectin type III domain-containing protein, partial [Spirillospora sp. NPDC029432]|uniref:fibronectin type III domain-containing protein n=1 Tax=Spirillospora sp. NPDC029432 TaxID=3154599 RepID=UPI0034561AA2